MADFIQRVRARCNRESRMAGLRYWFGARSLPPVDLDEKRFMYQTRPNLIHHGDDLEALMALRLETSDDSGT